MDTRLLHPWDFLGKSTGVGCHFLLHTGDTEDLPIQETRVKFLGQEDSLDEEMATHSSNLAQKIPCTKDLGELQSSQTRLSN